MTTLNFTQTLETESCCVCGIVFAMPAEYRRERRQKRDGFFCPSGHGQSYVDETEAERLQKQLSAKNDELARSRARAGPGAGV